MLRSGLLCGAALVFVAAATAGTAAAKEQFTTFDPTGSIYTVVAGINDSGTVAGYYEDSQGVSHGFLRAPDGTITSFDPAGSTATSVTGINDSGEAAGWYLDKSGSYHSFVRANDGTITAFNATQGYLPSLIGINAKGKVAGWYTTNNYQAAGFIGMPGGKIRQLNIAGMAINKKGAVTGTDGSQGFVRAPSGKVTTFAGPGNPHTTVPTTINDTGLVAGYDETVCGTPRGFSRNAGGGESLVTPPNTEWTVIRGVNDGGAMTGTYYYGGYHGFVRSSGGTYTTFDITGATYGTYPQGINKSGEVAGEYLDGNDGQHGFVGTP